jgi:hypothetical protein
MVCLHKLVQTVVQRHCEQQTDCRKARQNCWLKRLRTVDTWRQDKSCYITFWNARSCHFHCQDKSCYIYITFWHARSCHFHCQDKSCYITFWNARSCHYHYQHRLEEVENETSFDDETKKQWSLFRASDIGLKLPSLMQTSANQKKVLNWSI